MKELIQKRNVRIIAAAFASLFVIVAGIVFYMNNRYYEWFSYTSDNYSNILFVGGGNERLSAVGDEPIFNQDYLYLHASDDNIFSFSQLETDAWSMIAIEPGATTIALRSRFTDNRHYETWHSLGWQDIQDSTLLWRGRTENIFEHLQPTGLLDYVFDGDDDSMRHVLAQRLEFNSSDDDVVSISPDDGTITATGRGDATITIRQGDYILQTYRFHVKVAAERVEVDLDTVHLELGETHQLNVRMYPADADVEITYSSPGLHISSTGLITAPPYCCHAIRGNHTVHITAGEVSARVRVHVHNSYRLRWGEHSRSLLTTNNVIWSGAPWEFANPVPNCTGFRIRYRVDSLTDGSTDLGSVNLGRDWRVFVRADGIGWRNVGTVQVNSQDEFYYADISFSSRDVTHIFVILPANWAGGHRGSWQDTLELTNLYYNGVIH